MRLDIQTLRETFELAAAFTPDLAARFIGRLRRRDAAIGTELDELGPAAERVVLDMVRDILIHLHEPHWVEVRLLSLGALHPHDTDAKRFETIVDTLVDTLRESAGGGWSPRAERAWTQAADAFTRTVRVGAEAAASIANASATGGLRHRNGPAMWTE